MKEGKLTIEEIERLMAEAKTKRLEMTPEELDKITDENLCAAPNTE